jgi:hypothetical protein
MIRPLLAAMGLCACLVPAEPRAAQTHEDQDRARDDRIAELEHKLDVVVQELGALRAERAVPETEAELTSTHGYGPAASKVYSVAKGVSIGGYAEGSYHRQHDSDSSDEWDLTRAVLYLGYKFTDRLVWNSEIEFEHATTEQEGSVNVEFATLDYLWQPAANFRVGEVLVPMGFVNQVHEPPFYYGTRRPEPERVIIPATWGENGVGVFGDVGEQLHYQAYVVAGLDALGFTPDEGIRDGRQGASESLAEDLGWVGRLDFDVVPGLRVGGSYFTGRSGQDQQVDLGGGMIADVPHARTTLWEAHAEWRRRGLLARALWTEGRIGNTGELSALLSTLEGEPMPIASELRGGYIEAGYDLMPLLRPGSDASLEPFFRYEYVDPQQDVPDGFARMEDARSRTLIPGIQWKPIPNVALKVDWRRKQALRGGHHQGDELGFGFGLVF